MDICRQEKIVPLADTRAELEEDGHGGGGTRPEPPPQSTKPSLAIMRQRHLQESLGNTGGSRLHYSTFQKENLEIFPQVSVYKLVQSNKLK